MLSVSTYLHTFLCIASMYKGYLIAIPFQKISTQMRKNLRIARMNKIEKGHTYRPNFSYLGKSAYSKFSYTFACNENVLRSRTLLGVLCQQSQRNLCKSWRRAHLRGGGNESAPLPIYTTHYTQKLDSLILKNIHVWCSISTNHWGIHFRLWCHYQR